MATAASALSFQGLASGVQTDALVSAILAQDGLGVVALQARQTANTNRTSALTAMKSAMNSLFTSLAAMQDGLNTRTVTSTDPNNAYVTATASGAAAGNYDVTVSKVATRGRISSTMTGGAPSNLAVGSLTDTIFTNGVTTGSFAIQGTDGKVVSISVSDNSLTGLRDAINGSTAGVTATIINNGGTTNPYQLVLSAKDTGTGTTGGVVTIADTSGENNSLGIHSGTVGTDPTSGLPNITGGLTSTDSGVTANDAQFSVNGIQMTRKTNLVTDAADGVTFNLLQGGQSGTTTLSVTQDKTAATTALQDVISKYNTIVTGYASASTATKNADGTIKAAALTGDSTSKSMLNQIRSALTGMSSALAAAGAPYSSLAAIGVTTGSDGTLSLNTATFQAALAKNPSAVRNLFITSGGSNGAPTIKGPGQTASDLLFSLTSSGSSMLATALKTIQTNNNSLALQISAGQSALARQKDILQRQFSNMEVTVAQMRASAGSLIGA